MINTSDCLDQAIDDVSETLSIIISLCKEHRLNYKDPQTIIMINDLLVGSYAVILKKSLSLEDESDEVIDDEADVTPPKIRITNNL